MYSVGSISSNLPLSPWDTQERNLGQRGKVPQQKSKQTNVYVLWNCGEGGGGLYPVGGKWHPFSSCLMASTANMSPEFSGKSTQKNGLNLLCHQLTDVNLLTSPDLSSSHLHLKSCLYNQGEGKMEFINLVTATVSSNLSMFITLFMTATEHFSLSHSWH